MAAREAPCVLCGSTDWCFVVAAYDRMYARGEDYRYDRCAGCGLVAMRPLPQPEDIAGFYPDDYEAHAARAPKKDDKWVNRQASRYLYSVDSVDRSPLLRGLFRLLSNRVMKEVLEPHGSNRLLDVGCGAGAFLVRHRALGWAVKGIEPSAQALAVSRERGLDVHQGSVLDAPFEPHAFDVVCLNHVIEHVLDPVSVLRGAGRFLAPGGRLLVKTPNVRGIGFALYGSCWYALDAPRHIHLFSPRTMRLLGERAGLRPRRVRTEADPRILCDSRHYAETQGAELPAEVAVRARVIAESVRRKKPYRGYRKVMAPLAALCAVLGRGDTMRAEYRLPAEGGRRG